MSEREFESGANRDTDDGKLDFEGFLSPRVLVEFAEYMNEHRTLSDGTVRASDNWQKGMPLDVYMKSLLRHVMDLWLLHRTGDATRPEKDDAPVSWDEALGGIMFNLQGYWHSLILEAEEAEAAQSADLGRRQSDRALEDLSDVAFLRYLYAPYVPSITPFGSIT